MRVVCLGAGNLATHLALAIHKAGLQLVQVYSRTEERAQQLATRLDCPFTTRLEEVVPDADIYLFALKDSVLQQIIATLPSNNGLWVHTAGSLPMTLFKGYARRYGVLYPLQTFSRARAVDFSSLPLFPEANSPEDMELLCRVAQRLSKEVHPLDSERRKTLHLAAVFACNFTNHMYALAGKLLTEQQIPMHVLHPLIDETAAKIHTLTPSEAQTGPAVRYDENVMNNHLAMLSDPDMQSIYRLMSQHIHKEATNHE